MPSTAAQRRFRWFATSTVLIIYALILVGGIVRATGSGMGCPDWPMCFGQWIPPTSESQLPADYQQIYADRGYAETQFNVTKTWIEYLNRLLGVFTGFAILATLLAAVPFRKLDRKLFALSAAAFVLVGVQGWLGSRVVASNLDPAMITTHMLLAQVIVGLVVAAVVRSWRVELTSLDTSRLPRHLYTILIIAMGAGLLQMVMGTQVREAIDFIAKESDYVNRHLWIDNLPIIFAAHKWYAVPLTLLNAWLIHTLLTRSGSRTLRALSLALGGLILGTSVIGMSMDRLHLPIFAQPLHLLLASLIFGVQLALLLVMRTATRGAIVPPTSGAVDAATGTVDDSVAVVPVSAR